MRAGLYARVSREEQAEGYSIGAQLEAMSRFCEDRRWEIVAEYVEPGVSGTTTNRPAFQAALADCEAGKLDALITHQLDRFHRNLRHQLDTFGKLADWGVAFVSVTEQIDYSTPQGMLFLQMLGAFNEYYVANLRREIRKGKRGRARSGLSNSSLAPYGYVRMDGRDEIDPEAAEIIRFLFDEYATGHRTYIELADELVRRGARPSVRSRGAWTWHAVRWMLSNPYYAGWVPYEGELYQGQHEPIIDRKLWHEVQAVQARRTRRRTRRTQGSIIYLLQGLAFCSRCRCLLYSETHHGRRYYRDSAQVEGISCPGKYIRAEILEQQVADKIKRLCLPADWRARIIELAASPGEREQMEARQERAQEAARRLRQQYRWGMVDEGEFLQEHTAIQAELDSLVLPEIPAVEQAGLYLEQIGDLWDVATPAEQREAIQTMLKAVHVDPVERIVVLLEFHPDFLPLLEMEASDDQEN